MNRWAKTLERHPTSVLRLIAAAHRLGLPARTDRQDLLVGLRRGICRQKAVLALARQLPPELYAAAQALRDLRQGISRAELTERFGAIRPRAELVRRREPQTVSESLLLLGWLVPQSHRPVPQRYTLGPELREWLPHVQLTSLPPPPTQVAPAVAVARLLIVAADYLPLAVTLEGVLAVATLRRLFHMLPPDDTAAVRDCTVWLVALLIERELLVRVDNAVKPGRAAAEWLKRDPLSQTEELLQTWRNRREPDIWLERLRVNLEGIDWQRFTLRLLQWAAAAPEADYAEASARFGPLSDATTHGYAVSRRRTPWSVWRSADVWQAAQRGPLAWLGLTATTLPQLPEIAPPPGPEMEPPQQQPFVRLFVADPVLRRILRRTSTLQRALIDETISGGWLVAPGNAERVARALERETLRYDSAAERTAAERAYKLLLRLRRRVTQAQPIRFEYQGEADRYPRLRTVSDARLELQDGSWLLCGKCSEAAEERRFRLDRISAVEGPGWYNDGELLDE